MWPWVRRTLGHVTSASPLTWPDLPARQQPIWPDKAALADASARLASFPPLVFAGEADILRSRIAQAAQGKAFMLMGGDCAETFASATADNIRDRVKTILQMAAVLTYGASMPVVKIGRIAGQYAKPRSKDSETRDGVTLPSYRGDLVNDFAFTEQARTPDPHRLVEAYHASASTLNLVRAFTQGGFADLRYVHEWNKGFVKSSANSKYERIAHDIDKAMRFMVACGVDFDALKAVDVWASHEALVLDYEKPLTRIDSRTGKPYATSGHFVWVGERTRDIDGAHIDFISRITNPVGMKVGPSADVKDILAIAEKVNPTNAPGRLTLITRMGAKTIREKLPPILAGVKEAGACITWVCDPMHGNTFESSTGFKTRRFEDIVEEVRGFFDAHRDVGTVPGGIHLELTGNDVTECLGGTFKVDDLDLERRYETLCDPRLNHQQSLEMAFVIAEILSEQSRTGEELLHRA
ncbi:3-deoxy-7-phosphoheptulonate synthase class II [Dermatophilus congolensis]|nr:3-deoxy-7-phosphoheptulonate synthase class II [Dermatophilus congolensis]MBO3143024.1 3-deoxy-7-phosphoheptulonate synthase class II [Dermatophilus congolensis]MBO3152012.1 3-deoxy-7-phosphoheptulonate synthase class II [Dermatophilus congolensis]MBO3160979.1 3-deoxy-7-phosphoheptulonate synthase class II [Dermatophilus congolensis]MBO3163297.1 3-deoxy-7-phosphoheptulonate synthase class II [Dermatophilus congolensis]MBO3176854.1 3-deoxy-7-phosphoheptulonate synthase class II [Dermatophilu